MITDLRKLITLELKKGRFFSKDHASDLSAIVVNEAVVNAFGLKDPIGKNINSPWRPKRNEI